MLDVNDSILDYQENIEKCHEYLEQISSVAKELDCKTNSKLERFKSNLIQLKSNFEKIRQKITSNNDISISIEGLERKINEELNQNIQQLSEKISLLQNEITENIEINKSNEERYKIHSENPKVEQLKVEISLLESEYTKLVLLHMDVIEKEISKLSEIIRKEKIKYRMIKFINRLTFRKLSKEASVHQFKNREEIQEMITKAQEDEITQQKALIHASNSYKKIEHKEIILQIKSSNFEDSARQFLYFLIGITISLVTHKLITLN